LAGWLNIMQPWAVLSLSSHLYGRIIFINKTRYVLVIIGFFFQFTFRLIWEFWFIIFYFVLCWVV
jgi:hypothetical protein